MGGVCRSYLACKGVQEESRLGGDKTSHPLPRRDLPEGRGQRAKRPPHISSDKAAATPPHMRAGVELATHVRAGLVLWKWVGVGGGQGGGRRRRGGGRLLLFARLLALLWPRQGNLYDGARATDGPTHTYTQREALLPLGWRACTPLHPIPPPTLNASNRQQLLPLPPQTQPTHPPTPHHTTA